MTAGNAQYGRRRQGHAGVRGRICLRQDFSETGFFWDRICQGQSLSGAGFVWGSGIMLQLYLKLRTCGGTLTGIWCRFRAVSALFSFRAGARVLHPVQRVSACTPCFFVLLINNFSR